MTEVHEGLSVEDLAALVCSTLERHGVHVVLSGGSVVSIYSDNAYQSYDLDFIQTGLARTTNPAMEELGFTKQGRHWLRLLAPTECVMDRLAGFYHWNDRQCLEQALEVARRQQIDLVRIEKWSRDESSLARFLEFAERLA